MYTAGDDAYLRKDWSVAEIAYHDKWQRAVIAACILGNDKRHLESDMTRVRQLCEEAQEIQITDMHLQWL